MSNNQNSTERLLDSSDPPQCALPALLGPPKQAACFSLCNEQLRVDSIAALRYFAHPPENVNLKAGYDRLSHKQRSFKRVRRLDHILAMCLQSKNSKQLLKAEVITWRGILKKIMLGDKVDLNVSYHNGVLYVEEQGPRKMYCDPATYTGYKFETWCSSAYPQGAPGGAVDLQTQWNAAVIRKLGSLNVLLVGEVDCVKPEYIKHPRPEHYVELKTKTAKWAEGTYSYRKDWAKWEMQTLLIGGSKIFVGLPDTAGIVRKVDTLTVRDNLESVQPKIDWGARVLHSLIEYCARAPATNGVLKVWRVQLRKWYTDIRELGPAEVKALNQGDVPRNGILPVSFINGLQRKSTASRSV
ncbi:hypothetical protein B0H11DRAFT_1114157 [Mycena galericulata]|nr:hypothetical protein B0H11DRAFT_1114157 [Mycena galericulata]